jgi:Predicted unusual protein kinase
MKLYLQLLKAIIQKYIFRKDTGTVIKNLCESMGIIYIKLAQILATQNIGDFFNENNRISLSSICDNCHPIPYTEIEAILKQEYKEDFNKIFSFIDPNPVGSASISQVHKATLSNGQNVAVKVKRKDIANGIEKDIEQIRKLMNRYGKLFGFKNTPAGNKGLNIYLNWIKEETDFINEIKNIEKYSNFAKSVNGQIQGTKNINVPRVYRGLSTKNIIIMDFIEDKTINQQELTNAYKEKISKALNSYIKLSFHALLNNKKVIFHGDPHSGNIYIDKDGNIGFLDMGLLFELSEQDIEFTKQIFFAIYTKNENQIFYILTAMDKSQNQDKELLKKDIHNYLINIKGKPITSWFVDLISVCLNKEIVPPDFLFSMAKVFVCLNGIITFSENLTNASELIKEEITKYYVKRSINNLSDLTVQGLKLTPTLLDNFCTFGLTKGIVKSSSNVLDFHSKAINALNNLKEIIAMLNNNQDTSNTSNCRKKEKSN